MIEQAEQKCTFSPITSTSKFISLQAVFHGAVRNKTAMVPISGDCMEGVGIMDGGRVAVDFTHYPRPERRERGKYIPGDPCLCYAIAPRTDGYDQPTIMCKQYVGEWMGHMVCTRYKDACPRGNRMNFGFSAIAILGVVYSSWGPNGNLLWETDPETYPKELPSEITVKSGNVNVDQTFVGKGGTA